LRSEFGKAIEQYQKVLKLQPDFPMAHDCLNSCYLALGEYSKAIDELVLAKLRYGQDPAKVAQEADERRKALALSGPQGYFGKVPQQCQAGGATNHYLLSECTSG